MDNLMDEIFGGANPGEEADRPNRLTVQSIHISLLVPSKENQYGIRDIQELADNIKVFGLMQNLVVRPAQEKGKYEIISGERRYTALKSLHAEGDKRFSRVPCYVVDCKDETVMQMMLIFANAHTRQLNEYELVWQAEKLEQLIREAREKGAQVTGKTRHLIAEFLKVSSTQVSRLESIGRKLIPEGKQALKDGRIGISAAYEASTLPREEQKKALAAPDAAKPEAIKKAVAVQKVERKPARAPIPSGEEDIAGKLDRIAEDIAMGREVDLISVGGLCRKAAKIIRKG